MSDRRVQVAVTGFVYGYVNEGEDVATAQRRIALEAERRANLPGDIRVHLNLISSLPECVYCAAGQPPVPTPTGLAHLLGIQGDKNCIESQLAPCTNHNAINATGK